MIETFGKENKATSKSRLKISRRSTRNADDRWDDASDFTKLKPSKSRRSASSRSRKSSKSVRSDYTNRKERQSLKRSSSIKAKRPTKITRPEGGNILPRSEESYLITSITEIITLEKDLEMLKISLSMRDDFNLIDAFTLLDTRC